MSRLAVPATLLLLLVLSFDTTYAFLSVKITAQKSANSALASSVDHGDNQEVVSSTNHRRAALKRFASWAVTTGLMFPASAEAEESIFAPKFVQEYPDFTQTSEGWSYKDVKVGEGSSPKAGDRVVYEWSGYTIGYFGRPFEAKG